MDWPFPLWARNVSAAARAGRAHWCHSKPSTIPLFMVFVPLSFTSSSSSQGPLQFSELCKKPCHFLRPPRCPCKHRLLINSVSLSGGLLSLQWQTATFNSRLMENLYHHKTPSYLLLSSPGPHRDLTSKGCGRAAFNRLQGIVGGCPRPAPTSWLSSPTFRQNLINLALLQEWKQRREYRL